MRIQMSWPYHCDPSSDNEKLMDACRLGKFNSFKRLLRENPNILNQFEENPDGVGATNPLHVACSGGQSEFVDEIMNFKSSLARLLDQDGFSSMRLALRNRHDHVVRCLLKHDGDLIRLKDGDGLTALHYVAMKGQIEFLEEFLVSCPHSIEDVTETEKETAMHLALKNDELDAFMILIDHVCPEEALYLKGCILRWKNREGKTVLHYLVEKGEINVLKLFLLICPKSVEDVTDRGETALHIALQSHDEAFVLKLLETLLTSLHKAYPEEARYVEKRVLRWKDNVGDTILHIAASRNRPQIVEELLKHRVNIGAKNSEGLTGMEAEPAHSRIGNLLHNATAEDGTSFRLNADIFADNLSMDERLMKAAESGDVETLYDFLEGYPIILEDLESISNASTPLHVAARTGQTLFAMEILIRKPSVASKLNEDGLSPLHLAILNGHGETAKVFVNADSNLVMVKGKDMVTPLHLTAKLGYIDVLAVLLSACPSAIGDLTVRGETALHVAVENKKLVAFKFLFGWLHRVKQEDILNQKDNHHNTLLHIAIAKDNPQALKVLINNIDMNTKNLEKKTAKDIMNARKQSLSNDLLNAQKQSLGPEIIREIKGKIESQCEIERILNRHSFVSHFLNTLICKRDQYLGINVHGEGNFVSDIRNVVLVVAVLIATATYTVVLSPPSGNWGDGSDTHQAGKMIMGAWESSYFALLNSSAFCASVCTIIFLMMGLPFDYFLEACTLFISCSYFVSLFTIIPTYERTTMFLLVIILGILLCTHLIAFQAHRRQREKRAVGQELRKV